MKKVLQTARKLLPVLIGAVAGFAYYYFIGCHSGTCPITSNPYISTGYGAMMGVIYMLPTKKTQKSENDVTESKNEQV